MLKYVMVAGAFFCYFFTWGGFYAFSTIFDIIKDELGGNDTSNAWIQSVSVAILQFLSLITGALSQKFGARVVLVVSSILFGAGYVASFFVTSLWMLYLSFGVLSGLGSSGLVVASIAHVGQQFTKNRALAMGIVTAGSGIGSLVLAQVYHYITLALGWRYCFLITGLSAALILAIFGFLVPPQEPPRQNKPKVSAASILCSIRLLPIALSMPVTYLGYWIFNTFMVPYAALIGMSLEVQALMVSTSGVVTTVGRVICGLIADRVGALPLYVFSIIVRGSSTVCFTAFTDPTMFFIHITVSSILASGSLLFMTVCAEFYAKEHLPLITGFVYTFAGFGSLLGDPGTGYLLDHYGAQIAFPISGSVLVLGGMIVSTLWFCKEKVVPPVSSLSNF